MPIKVLESGRILIPEDAMPTPTSQWRRSLYILSRRNYHLPIFGVFDTPAMTTNCTSRNQSTVVLQSLTMLNDEFVQRLAALFAERVIQSTSPSIDDRIGMAFKISLSRRPTERERQWSSELLVDQAENQKAAGTPPDDIDRKAFENLCHMLLNTNNFLYLE